MLLKVLCALSSEPSKFVNLENMRNQDEWSGGNDLLKAAFSSGLAGVYDVAEKSELCLFAESYGTSDQSNMQALRSLEMNLSERDKQQHATLPN